MSPVVGTIMEEKLEASEYPIPEVIGDGYSEDYDAQNYVRNVLSSSSNNYNIIVDNSVIPNNTESCGFMMIVKSWDWSDLAVYFLKLSGESSSVSLIGNGANIAFLINETIIAETINEFTNETYNMIVLNCYFKLNELRVDLYLNNTLSFSITTNILPSSIKTSLGLSSGNDLAISEFWFKKGTIFSRQEIDRCYNKFQGV